MLKLTTDRHEASRGLFATPQLLVVSYVGYRFVTACSEMRCSVVFGVTLRLLVINITWSSPAINTAAYYQRCVITCDTLAVLHRRPSLQHLPVAALTQAVKPDIGLG